MRIIREQITIKLDNEQEVDDFWNVIMFALDLHNERTKKGEICMTDSEYRLANDLAETVKQYYS